MIRPRITFLGSQENLLNGWLTSHPNGHERGALILFRKFLRPIEGLPDSIRFVAIELILMKDDWILSSSKTHLKINMRKLPDLYFRCEQEGLELGFAHSHPDGNLFFSEKDNINEENILHGLSGCNGENSYLIALILSDNRWICRVRKGNSPRLFIPVRHILILTNRIDVHGIDDDNELPEVTRRQEAALGKPFTLKLRSLRVAIVGLGGTGSPIATMLARCGIAELILIDGDTVAESNLNRVRGYTISDIGLNKAESLKLFIDSIKLKTTTKAIPEYINKSSEAIDALSSADVVFGCTDDVLGRDILNQALYYYCQPLIDVGLSGFIDLDKTGEPYLRDHRGRVSCILPEYGSCLRCQDIISDQKIDYEQAVIDRPELLELDADVLLREYYLIGGNEEAPGVGPFTSMTADNGIATFMNLIANFRNLPNDLRQDNIWIDFVHLTIHSNLPKSEGNCIYCDVHAILLKKENYRLDMPALGKALNL